LGASGLAAFGCTNEQFATVDAQLVAVKQASAKIPDPQIVSAAAAASLAGLELAKALMGGMAAAAPGPATARPLRLLAFEPGRNKTEPIDANGVKGSVTYDTYVSDRSRFATRIVNFDVVASGYTVKAKGQFDYETSTGAGVKGKVQASLEGSLTWGDQTYNIMGVALNTQDPLPSNSTDIGSIAMDRLYRDGGRYRYMILAGQLGTKDGKLAGSLRLFDTQDNYVNKVPLGAPIPLTGF
jgi:hypothetical protein